METNIYKSFRPYLYEVAKENSFTKRFDEPTYFSFRLVFAQDKDHIYNMSSNNALYDTMPHPLFDTNVDTVSSINQTQPLLLVPSMGLANNIMPNIVSEPISYSAISYLVNANEPTRASMLQEFINKFTVLQNDFPYYFQSIEGVADLLKIDTTKGQRITSDKKLIITCLEGLDLKISYLLNLYRKIAWDDVYQRWVLPDMMRYFTLKIYLAEFRTFHLPVINETTFPMGTETKTTANTPLVLRLLDSVLPTWEITCEMCEFDINDISFTHLEGLNVGSTPNQGTVKFAVKVGNIKELQIYPLFEHMFLVDRKLNGLNRAKDEISTSADVNSNYLYPASLQISQTREKLSSNDEHESGLPYNVRTNDPGQIREADIEQERISSSSLDVNFNATQPETWVGNAINFGKAYAESFVNKVVDRAKITSIPNLGISYTEVITAIQSKNIVAALGTIRKGVNEVVNQYGNAPSSRLDGPIQTDNIMKDFLSALTKSEATDDDTILLQKAASIALSDKSVWDQIKSYSLSTNLIDQSRTNTSERLGSEISNEPQPIVLPSSKLSSNIVQDKVLPKIDSNIKTTSIDVTKVIEYTPTSKLQIEGETIPQPLPSKATTSKLQK